MTGWKAREHQHGPGGDKNTKWVDKEMRCEVVYDGDGNMVTNTLNGGTYNFGPATSISAYPDHFIKDMLPYYLWGNGPIIVTPETVGGGGE